MAGPSIMVRLLGDVSSLGSSFNTIASKGSTAAASLHSAFSSTLGTLNQSGVLGPFGGALQTADQSLQNMHAHAKSIGPTMMGVGGAALGLGMALSAAGSKDAAAHAQLQSAISATGKSYDTYAGKIEDAIKHQEHFGNTAGDTQDALRVLTQATNDPTKALGLLNTATDLAAAKHESLSAAAATLGKAYNGSGKVMKEFGIAVSSTGTAAKELTTAQKAHTAAVDAAQKSTRSLAELQVADAASKTHTALQAMKLQDAQAKVHAANLKVITSNQALTKAQKDVASGSSTNSKALDELGKKLSGQASAQADTFTGHLHALRAEVEDHIAAFGQKYGPALSTAGAAMAGLGGAVTATKGITDALKDSQMIQTTVTKIQTIATMALNSALLDNPIGLVVAAIVILIAIVIAIGIKFGWWKAIAHDLWDFIKIAFDGIRTAISSVFDWIAQHWPLLVGMLFGPFGIAVALILTHWSDVVAFFTSLPTKILQAIGGVKNLLLGVGHDIIDGLLRGLTEAWHKVDDFMSSAADKVKNFLKNPLSIFSPSKEMMTQGAQIMQGLGMGLAAGFTQHVAPTLANTIGALLGPQHGGTVTPAASSAASSTASSSSGPVVSIQHAHFGAAVDVDSFMQRAAWVARTRGLAS